MFYTSVLFYKRILSWVQWILFDRPIIHPLASIYSRLIPQNDGASCFHYIPGDTTKKRPFGSV
jgi:hypothetical protein